MGSPRLMFVCNTCDRNGAIGPSGHSAGELLASDIRAHIASVDDTGGWSVRDVACLNGCLRPCNVGFRGRGRFTYRFSRVVDADAAALLRFGAEYWDSAQGMVNDDRIPLVLRTKMTVCMPPWGVSG